MGQILWDGNGDEIIGTGWDWLENPQGWDWDGENRGDGDNLFYHVTLYRRIMHFLQFLQQIVANAVQQAAANVFSFKDMFTIYVAYHIGGSF